MRKSALQKIHFKGQCESGQGVPDPEAWPLGFSPHTWQANLPPLPLPSHVFRAPVRLDSHVPGAAPGLAYPKRCVNICPEPKISFISAFPAHLKVLPGLLPFNQIDSVLETLRALIICNAVDIIYLIV